eukprot:14548713-Heterocapsa_arctica.AAC.1
MRKQSSSTPLSKAVRRSTDRHPFCRCRGLGPCSRMAAQGHLTLRGPSTDHLMPGDSESASTT